MALLFDTDAVSETMRTRPLPGFVNWLRFVPSSEQFTSAVVIGELLKGAYGSSRRSPELEDRIEKVIERVKILPFDVGTAHVFGALAARLDDEGEPLDIADLQIAATALHYGLELVTGNVKHFERVPGLRINRSLVEARHGK